MEPLHGSIFLTCSVRPALASCGVPLAGVGETEPQAGPASTPAPRAAVATADPIRTFHPRDNIRPPSGFQPCPQDASGHDQTQTPQMATPGRSGRCPARGREYVADWGCGPGSMTTGGCQSYWLPVPETGVPRILRVDEFTLRQVYATLLMDAQTGQQAAGPAPAARALPWEPAAGAARRVTRHRTL